MTPSSTTEPDGSSLENTLTPKGTWPATTSAERGGANRTFTVTVSPRHDVHRRGFRGGPYACLADDVDRELIDDPPGIANGDRAAGLLAWFDRQARGGQRRRCSHTPSLRYRRPRGRSGRVSCGAPQVAPTGSRSTAPDERRLFGAQYDDERVRQDGPEPWPAHRRPRQGALEVPCSNTTVRESRAPPIGSTSSPLAVVGRFRASTVRYSSR
jgi:hypothetical protein